MPRKKNTYEKKLEYNNAYNRENYRSFSIRYSKDSEKKIISWLEKQPGVKAYITDLILADMESAKAKKAKKAVVRKAAK
ncbi:hypothetical protein [Anaerolactibacter massiliensis]|uniref:hypothetical protein n=1 Tax=Anaerolactibacter massiliensis TaxID=2044573 RepID=UPI000CF9BEA6|nr:hypothetical protein [Anaerolactibacter massiliensis]